MRKPEEFFLKRDPGCHALMPESQRGFYVWNHVAITALFESFWSEAACRRFASLLHQYCPALVATCTVGEVSQTMI